MKLPSGSFIFWTAIIAGITVIFVLPFVSKFLPGKTEETTK